MADRQQFPVGDTQFGQLVQTNKPLQVKNEVPNWDAFGTITVSTAVLTLTPNHLNHNYAMITVETNPVRYTVDGTIPTASLGHLLSPGDILELTSVQEVKNFRVIRQSAADATLMASFGNI